MKLLCVHKPPNDPRSACEPAPELEIGCPYTLREVFPKGTIGYIPTGFGWEEVTLLNEFYSLMEFDETDIYPSSCFIPLDGTEECSTLTVEELLNQSPVVKELV